MNKESEADLNLLQGSWSQTYLEADGVVEPPDDEHSADGAVTIFEGQEFRVLAPDNTLLLKGSFSLDATTEPKAITWVDAIGEDAGRALPSIYHLTETTFKFIAADEGQPRPEAFKTQQGLTMREFIRATWLTSRGQ